MRGSRSIQAGLVVFLFSSAAFGQQSALLSDRQSLELYKRTVQLMEAAAVATPELARAGAPVTENVRQALINLERGQTVAVTNTLLMNLKAYLALTDAVPKPYPFPEEARRQLAELRESAIRIESHFQALLEQRDSQLRSPDRDNLRRYAEANARLAPTDASKPRVVFLGDSITDGWRLNEYFPERDFVNRGISGQISGEMLGRMKADVLDLKPAAMVVLAGTNDIARGVALTTIQNNLTMIADLAEVHHVKLVLASILPVSDYHKGENPRNEQTKRRPPSSIQSMNRWLIDFCRKRGIVYLDYYSKLVDQAGYIRTDLADDGLHPNAAGYRVMAPLALEAIEKVAAPPAQPKAKKRRLPF